LEFPSFAERVKILKVEASKMGAYDEVSVYASDNIKPEILLLESPNRIAMAFANTTIYETITIPGSSPNIRIIQAAQFDENTVYVIVEPKETLSYEYASLIGRNKFILELTKARPGSLKTIAPSEPVIIEAAAIVKVPPKKVPVKAIGTKEAKLPLKNKVIVIDPGHGGKDPGYVGKYGTLEKHLTYKVALKLKRILREAGASVFLTRYSDVSVKNGKIVEIANGRNADLFIALHFNSYTSPRTTGCETFYFTPQSRKFAMIMQKTLCSTIKRRNRGVKKDMYYTIHHTTMPSVLVEAVYLTNPKEEKLILKPAFQETVAYGIYKGIIEYVKIGL
jgi:N-acetylmuramoyl-L-alanine amidase